MTKRRRKMGNPFVHVELHTQDPEEAKKFYGKLFDWKLQDVSEMSYTVIDVGETGKGGGIMKSPMPDAPPQWVPYVYVDDVSSSTAKAQSLGATVLQDATEIPDIGWFSMLLDPTGAAFALFHPKM
jgi:predicted enzyme related to lactoylglutathione lyase